MSNKSEFNKNNSYKKTKNDYFYTNSSTISGTSDTLLYFLNSDEEKLFISMEYVLNILKGPNTQSKNILVNRLSDFFFNTNGIYASMIEKSVGIMTFDRVITKGNYKNGKDIYVSLLRTICEQYAGKNAFRSTLRYGNFYGYFSYNEKNEVENFDYDYFVDRTKLKTEQFSNASITPLDPRYIKVIATDGNTYKIAIDISQLTDFDMQGMPREIYDDIMSARHSYNDKVKKLKEKKIKKISKQYYILDDKKTITIKLRANINESCGRAAFVNSLAELIYEGDLLKRQKGILDKSSKTLIYQTYPEGQKGKGTSAMTKSQMEAQHDSIYNALQGFAYSEMGFCSLYPNTKLNTIDVGVLLSSFSSSDIIKRISTSSGFSTGLLNGEDIKNDKVLPFLYEILSAEFDDFLIQWEKELNKVLMNTLNKNNNNVMNFPYIKYLPTNRLNRKDYAEMYRRSFSDAGGSYQLYLASTGVQPEIQLELMDEEEEMQFRTKYPAHPMASTSSGSIETKVTETDVVEDMTEEVDVEEDTKTKTTKSNKNKKTKDGNNEK